MNDRKSIDNEPSSTQPVHSSTRSAAFSPIMIDAALVLDEHMPGPATRARGIGGKGDPAGHRRSGRCRPAGRHQGHGTDEVAPVRFCKMGVDDMAVVDPELRARGTLGLRVADSSITALIRVERKACLRGRPALSSVSPTCLRPAERTRQRPRYRPLRPGLPSGCRLGVSDRLPAEPRCVPLAPSG
ncbi:hypothetical protein CBM2588_A80106 [Cupriavidus taiwanensis]|nr:hypothetical protein CBM2588_A80106 [Cupriavidus taiwanensis]